MRSKDNMGNKIVNFNSVEDKIFTIRDIQAILDSDVAEMCSYT